MQAFQDTPSTSFHKLMHLSILKLNLASIYIIYLVPKVLYAAS